MFEFDFFIQLDADVEECVDGELWADDRVVAVMRVEFEEIKKGFWQDYVSICQILSDKSNPAYPLPWNG
jgi:hypothetical protein